MNATRVPFFALLKQIPLALIALLSCALSFWLTVRFCARLAPAHAALEIVAMGLIWEISKITFGTLGAHRVAHGEPEQRSLGRVLVAVSVVLATGSVVASLAYLRQADSDMSQQALHASQAYRRGTASLAAMDQEMATLRGLADQDAQQMFRTRSLRTLDRVSVLRAERARVVKELARLESGGGKAAAPATLPAAGLGMIACAQCVVAVMLELVGMLAMALLLPRRVHAPEGPKIAAAAAAPAPAHEPDLIGDWSKTYVRARDMVVSSRLKPTYRAMRSALDISQPTALAFLQTMTAEGVLRRVGRQYTLAHGAAAGGAA